MDVRDTQEGESGGLSELWELEVVSDSLQPHGL